MTRDEFAYAKVLHVNGCCARREGQLSLQIYDKVDREHLVNREFPKVRIVWMDSLRGYFHAAQECPVLKGKSARA